MGKRAFGPYRLVQQIAVGGMAEIHLAKTHGIAGFEKYVALKMIHPNYSQDHQFIQMLIDEAKITVQLQHVNIAQTFDLGRVGDTFYITMEYVDGADLYRLLRKSADRERVFPVPLAAFIAKEVASGLDYAHRKRDHNGRPLGIVHRDVSPQNVLISYAGEVKLVDFGIAKATMRARQTAAGVIKGKYYYMSPEQAWGEPLDQRTDIFSAGILLYESLTGQMLYLEDDLHRLLDQVRRAHIPPPSTLRSEIPSQLDAIVMHALAREQDDRYQSAGDLAQDLERFIHSFAPVFTAKQVSAWISETLGQAAAPTLLGVRGQDEPERDRGGARRLTQDQLVRARSEFSDENSIIFGDDGRREPGRRRRASEVTSTYDDLVTGAGPDDDEDDVDSLPGPPLDQAPARRSAIGSVRSASLPAAGRSDGEMAWWARATVSEAPLNGSEYVEPPTLPVPNLIPDRTHDVPTERTGTPPGPRAPGEETQLLIEAALSSLSDRAAPSSLEPGAGQGPDLAAPVELMDEDSSGMALEDATLISDPPTWWSLPGDHTRPLDGPFGDQGSAAPLAAIEEADHEADTETIPNPRTPRPRVDPPATWEPAPALAARVPRPALSQLRTPKVSRRTPPGGAPARSAGTAREGAHDPTSGRTASVLANLLAPAEVRAAPKIALSPPIALTEVGHGQRQPARPVPLPTRPPNATFSGTPAPSRQPFSSRAITAELERNEIPDEYKIRSRPLPTRVLVGTIAFIMTGALAAALLALHGSGGGGEGGGKPVLQIISIPAGATVTVDGQVLPERTPTEIRGTPGARFLFGFELPRYQNEEQEFVVPMQGNEHQVIVRLDPMVVKLTIESVPSGAEVFLAGNSVGRTPLELTGLDPQSSQWVELRLKGFRPVRQTLDWSTRTEQRLLIALSP